MNEISKNGKVIKYVKDNKDLAKYLPVEDTVLSVKLIEGGRRMLYKKNGWYQIMNVDRDFGTGAGDICQICNAGVLTEYGGCYTCPNCNAQIRCGL